jgi:hypothetical protein
MSNRKPYELVEGFKREQTTVTDDVNSAMQSTATNVEVEE